MGFWKTQNKKLKATEINVFRLFFTPPALFFNTTDYNHIVKENENKNYLIKSRDNFDYFS
jgi:hypothetical protein